MEKPVQDKKTCKVQSQGAPTSNLAAKSIQRSMGKAYTHTTISHAERYRGWVTSESGSERRWFHLCMFIVYYEEKIFLKKSCNHVMKEHKLVRIGKAGNYFPLHLIGLIDVISGQKRFKGSFNELGHVAG